MSIELKRGNAAGQRDRHETLYVVERGEESTIYVVFVKIYFDNVYKY